MRGGTAAREAPKPAEEPEPGDDDDDIDGVAQALADQPVDMKLEEGAKRGKFNYTVRQPCGNPIQVQWGP